VVCLFFLFFVGGGGGGGGGGVNKIFLNKTRGWKAVSTTSFQADKIST
jgi:hypothetical protein